MEFHITHGPAVPQNDLQFVKAGTLLVTPQAVQFGGKWRTVTPAKPSIWTFIMPLLFIAALTMDRWLPQAWQAGIGNTALDILKFIIYLSYAAFFLLQSVPFSKKITASREELREIARFGRELTFLFRDRKGQERHALFNTDTEEEAAAIETALRDSGTEQTFIITYGPAAARPIMPVPGQIVIGPESVHLEGRVPRDPYPDRRRMRKIPLVIFVVVMLIVLVPVIMITSSMSSGSAFISPEIFIGITTAAMILLMVVAIIYTVRRMRVADVQKVEIADIRQQGEEVSFRAPLEGNHGVSGVTTVMQAGSPEQAAAIAQALAARTEGSTPFTVNYGLKRNLNPFGLAGNGRLGVAPDAVRISGDRIIAIKSLPVIIGVFILAFIPVIIVFVLAWRAFQDIMFALVTGFFVLFIICSVSSLLLRFMFGQVSIPRRDIIAMERAGRQLTLCARIAGREEQAVFHMRTEEEAAALSNALGQ